MELSAPHAGVEARPAFAAGNTIVLKPAEQTPLMRARRRTHRGSRISRGSREHRARIGQTAGQAIAGHMDVDKVAFTGRPKSASSSCGPRADESQARLARMGGKSPNIVFADADMDNAIEGSISPCFSTGPMLRGGSRLFVERKDHDEFVERSVDRAKRRTVGDPFDEKTQQGPRLTVRNLKR